MLRCALRRPRAIGGGSGTARAIAVAGAGAGIAVTSAGILRAAAALFGGPAGEEAAIAATMTKHGIAMPPQT
jgi:hypothetical protein